MFALGKSRIVRKVGSSFSSTLAVTGVLASVLSACSGAAPGAGADDTTDVVPALPSSGAAPAGLRGKISVSFRRATKTLAFTPVSGSTTQAAAYGKLPSLNSGSSELVSAESDFVAYCDGTTKECTDAYGAVVDVSTCPGWTTSSTFSAYCFDIRFVNGYTRSLSGAYLVINDMVPHTGYEPLNSDSPPAGSGLYSTYGLWSFGTVPAASSATSFGRSESRRWTLKDGGGDFNLHVEAFSDACGANQLFCDDGCKDYLTDANNCGGCGVVCDSTCSAGLCATSTLASGQTGVRFVSATGTSVVWGVSDKVMSIARSGGTATTLDSAAYGVSHTAVTGTTVLYYSADNRAESRNPHVRGLTDGTKSSLASATGGTQGITSDGTYVYWVASNRTTIYRAPLAGGAAATVTTGVANAFRIATDGTYVFIGENPSPTSAAGRLVRVKADGSGDLTKLGAGYVSDLSLDGDSVYWVNHALNGSVNRIKKDAASSTENVVLASARPCPYALAADKSVSPTMVYWTDDTSPGATTCDSNFTDGVVARVSASGTGSVETLATSQTRMDGIAVDDTYVYWTKTSDGNILKLRKPPILSAQPDAPCNPQVLILRDSNNTTANNRNITNLTSAMTALGLSPTVDAVGTVVGTATSKTFTDYGAVVLLTGDDSLNTTDLNSNTQTALKTAVSSSRVGLVMTGGASYKRAQGKWATLATFVLMGGAGNANLTAPLFTHVPTTAASWRAELFQGIVFQSEQFSPTPNGVLGILASNALLNGGSATAKAGNSGTATAYNSVAYRDDDGSGRGRVVHLGLFGGSTGSASGGQYFTATPNDVTRLVVNSARWAARCL